MKDPYEILGVTRDADREEIRSAYLRLVQQVHPDAGGNDALFRTVQDAYDRLSGPQERTNVGTDDARDSASPTAQPNSAHEAADKRPPRPDECMACGRKGAVRVRLREHTGLLLAWSADELDGELCRDCGIALFRQYMNWTLGLGWWGVLAFYANFYPIILNLIAYSRVVNSRPGRRPRNVDTPLLKPMDPGQPLVKRPGIWAAPSALVVILLFGA